MNRIHSLDEHREKELYPTLFYKDQLAHLEAIANETGEPVAALVRAAIDAYFFPRLEPLR
jgi:hypothetical protein